MIRNEDSIKAFNLRITKGLWMFLKKVSGEQEIPMNAIIQNLIEKYRAKLEKKHKKDIDSL